MIWSHACCTCQSLLKLIPNLWEWHVSPGEDAAALRTCENWCPVCSQSPFKSRSLSCAHFYFCSLDQVWLQQTPHDVRERLWKNLKRPFQSAAGFPGGNLVPKCCRVSWRPQKTQLYWFSMILAVHRGPYKWPWNYKHNGACPLESGIMMNVNQVGHVTNPVFQPLLWQSLSDCCDL